MERSRGRASLFYSGHVHLECHVRKQPLVFNIMFFRISLKGDSEIIENRNIYQQRCNVRIVFASYCLNVKNEESVIMMYVRRILVLTWLQRLSVLGTRSLLILARHRGSADGANELRYLSYKYK